MQPQSCLTKNRSKVDTLFIEDKVLVSMGQDDIEGISQEGKKLYSQA